MTSRDMVQARPSAAAPAAGDELQRRILHQISTGAWGVADELLCLADELGEPRLYPRALLAALRGKYQESEELIDRLTTAALLNGEPISLREARLVGALAWLGRRELDRAHRHALSVLGGTEEALSSAIAASVLAETAVRTHRVEYVRDRLVIPESEGSIRVAMWCRAVPAILAGPEDAQLAADGFEAALAVPGSAGRPFDRARIHLLYGEMLRRTRATARSRSQLESALTLFKDLGAAPWARRTAVELRAAAGLRRPVSGPEPRMTAREQEVAELAARGLSNREIGELLHLSPRTVGSHLNGVYSKLGVLSRAGLRDALLSVAG